VSQEDFMARVNPLEVSKLAPDFAEMARQLASAGRSPVLAQVLGQAPELFRSYFRFYYPAHEQGIVDTPTKEVARLEIARLNDCPT
jgi:hypothetical protein